MRKLAQLTGRILLLSVLVGLAVLLMAQPGQCKEKFIKSSDYRDKDFRKGCIQDYAELEEGDDISWVWVAPGVTLSDYKVQVTSFEDFSDEIKKSQLREIKKIFQESVEKRRGDKGLLDAEVCVYEVQKFSPGKAWIPFAGGYQMQAGVGAEMILRTADKKIVAKFRHFAREGGQIEQAAEEVADDLKKYMSKH
jgi:hypothetical protein